MKSKLITLYVGLFSIPCLSLLVGIFMESNSIIEFSFGWCLVQTLITPACYTVLRLWEHFKEQSED